jgi:hypothetical protein
MFNSRSKNMKIIVPYLFFVLILASCTKNINDPAWLEISEWELQANSNLGTTEGELSHNFSDAWIYADGKLIGVFELPVKLPILLEGSTKFRIFPAILNNGISATKKIYPFVEPYEITLDLKKNETISINPVTKHYDQVKFWIENFEDSPKFESSGTESLASLVQANDPSILKYGNYYGLISLNPVDSVYIGYTLENDKLYLPQKGAEVYLEVDYRSTNSLVTGLIEHSASLVKYHPNVQLNGQDPNGEVVWKKIYIDMREIVSGTSQSEYYKISLIARLNDGGIDRQVVIDNVKILHY